MLRYLTISVLFFMLSAPVFSQEVTAVHEIKKGTEPNQYSVKTTIIGLEGVDIARTTYMIEDAHSYKKMQGNELFSSRNKDYIKFYVMAVPASGVVVIELSLKLLNGQGFDFPVEFQFSRNESKKIVQLPHLVFERTEELLAAVVETPPMPIPAPVVELPKKTEVTDILSDTEKVENPIKADEKIAENSTDLKIETAIDLPSGVEKQATIKEELSDTKVKYTIQILSLANFSKERFSEFCDEHSLLDEEVSTRKVNGITKVVYGKANSLDEARKLIEKLKLYNNIDGAFAVPL